MNTDENANKEEGDRRRCGTNAQLCCLRKQRRREYKVERRLLRTRREQNMNRDENANKVEGDVERMHSSAARGHGERAGENVGLKGDYYEQKEKRT
jgi:hypothetical protein